MVYEWDPRKAEKNRQKHGVSFLEAVSVFLDPSHGHSQTQITPELSIGRVVFIAHCQRGERTRLISARRATKKERKQYEEGID